MKRYQGNSGQVTRVPEVVWEEPPMRPNFSSAPALQPAGMPLQQGMGIANPPGASLGANAGSGGLLGGLGNLIPNLGGLGSLGGLGGLGGLGSLFSGAGNGLGGLFHGVGDGLGKIFSKNMLEDLELEDIILALVLYLMYRESKDTELLFILGAMLFF